MFPNWAQLAKPAKPKWAASPNPAGSGSVTGNDMAQPIGRFVRKMPTERLKPALGPATLRAVYCETDDATGLAVRVTPLRLGGRLAEQGPG